MWYIPTICPSLSPLRYETEGLNFFESQKEYQKGPNNISDLWTKYNIGVYLFATPVYTNMFASLEAAEEADSSESLEHDDEQYPQLPENVLKL
jgi:hypothetical protein